MKRFLLLTIIVISLNAVFAQTALKILKNDGSVTYINTSAVDKITFETPLAIGDTYQGGKIFYLDASGEHGLIAAPYDQHNGSSIKWNMDTHKTTGATRAGVGGGEENTPRIVGKQGIPANFSYASYLCDTLTIGG